MSGKVKAQKSRPVPLKWRILVVLFLLFITAAGLATMSSPADFFIDDTLFAAEIKAAAERHGIDPQLVRALIYHGSRFRTAARGRSGEIGLMQILPSGSAADYARVNKIPVYSTRDLYNVECNLEIGCWYLGRALRRWQKFSNGTELALAQYNAGESRAKKWQPSAPDGEVVPGITIKSTRNYVTRIMNRYRRYKAGK